MMNQVETRFACVGEGVRFERVRRITGYLVGDFSRFNDAKAAEVRDRVKHMDVRRSDGLAFCS